MNQQKELFVFVEGQTDEDFFDRIIRPKVLPMHSLRIIQYAQRGPLVNKFIRFCENQGKKYVYLTDIDMSPCVTHKKQKILRGLKISQNVIKVVKSEIESWYIAGISKEGSKKLNAYPYGNTEPITKEEFYTKWKPVNITETAFRLELLQYFCSSQASNRNQSFSYFVRCMCNELGITI